jgi:hypothetical protein
VLVAREAMRVQTGQWAMPIDLWAA